ncbi:hypothetical protein BDV12DRAFT_206925 [Aspergillus spectabilis]
MQSCDICRKRKVRCDRRTPCARCRRLRQPCSYTDILRKKGPKFVHNYPSIYTSTPTSASASGSGVSLRVYEREARSGIGEVDGMSGFEGMGGISGIVTASGSGTGTGSEVGSELELEVEVDMGMDFDGRISPIQTQSQGPILDGDILSLYEESLYPLFPIVDLHEIRLGFQFGYNHGSTRYAMLCSISAAVHAHLASSSPEDENEHEMACERFLRDAIHTRAQFDISVLHPHARGNDNGITCDREKMLSSFFLFMAYWYLRRERHAWWYLRECIALLFSSRLHREDEYRRIEPREAECRRMIFWGVFVTERIFCLLHDKPITLRPWIELPSLLNALDDDSITSGFMRLVTLFRGVDVDLSGCWTAAGFMTPVTLSLATAFPAEYDDINAGLPIQRFDLAITREWLRAKMWKLGIPQGRSSSEFVASNENAHWRLDEPLFIGKAILGILQSLSDVLGDGWSGILDQKLCDICECLYDIQPVMQTRGRAGGFDLDQILRGLLEVLSGFRGRSITQRRL